jgi:hypothetical protein
MARGQSGRIVIEVDPALKQDLYVALAKSNCTLKHWFLGAAVQFCEEQAQPDLFGPTNRATPVSPDFVPEET